MLGGDAISAVGGTNQWVVDQQTNWLEGCLKCCGICCADFENTYNIYKKGDKKPVYVVQEDSTCCDRMLCNPHHKIELNWSAPSYGKDTVIQVIKPFKCCCPAVASCCQKEIQVWKQQGGANTKMIGYVQQPWCGGCFTPTLEVYNNNEDDKSNIGYVSGPCCCIGACCSSHWDFKDPKGHEHVSMKRGGAMDVGIARNAGTNSDRYDVTFEDNSITNESKITMLATIVFIDYLFFEGETDCTCVWCTWKFPFIKCPPAIWCKLWDWYCCGCTIPCKVKCCLDDALEAGAKAQSGGIL